MKDLGAFEWMALALAATSAVLLVWAEYGRRAAVAALAMALGLVLLTIPGCGDDRPEEVCVVTACPLHSGPATYLCRGADGAMCAPLGATSPCMAACPAPGGGR